MPRYGADVKNACRRRFVVDGETPETISAELDGQPSAATVYRWAGPKPTDGDVPAHGTWWAERADEEEHLYRAASPASLIRDVAQLLQEVRDSKDTPAKKADAISKLAAAVDKLSRPEMQLPAMYHVLEELLRYVKKHAPDLFGRPLVLLIRQFKNHLRLRVERGGL